MLVQFHILDIKKDKTFKENRELWFIAQWLDNQLEGHRFKSQHCIALEQNLYPLVV